MTHPLLTLLSIESAPHRSTNLPRRRSGQFSRRRLFTLGLLALLLQICPSAWAAPYVNGTYITSQGTGTIRFTPLRAIARLGYEGRFVIDGKTYPGSLYAASGGGTGLVWYYGSSGIQAGNALVDLQLGNSYAGPISFTDRKGNLIASGTTSISITQK